MENVASTTDKKYRSSKTVQGMLFFAGKNLSGLNIFIMPPKAIMPILLFLYVACFSESYLLKTLFLLNKSKFK
jgi:hypothetical protein